jgi:hypothetical protein
MRKKGAPRRALTVEVAFLPKFTSMPMRLPLYLDVKGELGHTTNGNEEEHPRTIEPLAHGGTHAAVASK